MVLTFFYFTIISRALTIVGKKQCSLNKTVKKSLAVGFKKFLKEHFVCKDIFNLSKIFANIN